MATKRKGRKASEARSSPDLDAAARRLATRVRELRLEAKLTQEAAAERAHLDEKHWQLLEGGRGNPTLASLAAVAKSLKVKIRDLFE